MYAGYMVTRREFGFLTAGAAGTMRRPTRKRLSSSELTRAAAVRESTFIDSIPRPAS